jgi:hypothetical protein
MSIEGVTHTTSSRVDARSQELEGKPMPLMQAACRGAAGGGGAGAGGFPGAGGPG